MQKAAAGTVPTGPARGGVVIQASGALAQGLEVEQTAGGLPTAACGSPGTDFWFTGPGQRTAGRIQLYLMNPGSQAADADADIFTDAGPLQETTDTGITVPPHGMIVQTLAGTLRNSRAITLHVRTSVGQVVAAVQESTGAGQGAWLPAAQPPATRLVIPGLPAIAGTRQLYVAVPGLKDANVQVTAVTSRGSYQPTGASGIDLPAGSAAEISLPSVAGIPAALRLTSNTPITASILIPGGSGGSPGSFTAAAPAIQEQGVVADNMVGPARSSSLVLSAPQRAAQVTVTQVAAGGPGPAADPGGPDRRGQERRGPAPGHPGCRARDPVRPGAHAVGRVRAGLRGPGGHRQWRRRGAAGLAAGSERPQHGAAPRGPERIHHHHPLTAPAARQALPADGLGGRCQSSGS